MWRCRAGPLLGHRRVRPPAAANSHPGARGRRRLPPSWRGWLGAGLIALVTAGPATRLALGAWPASDGWLPQEQVAQTVAPLAEPVVVVGADGTVWVAFQDDGGVSAANNTGSGWQPAQRIGAGFGVDLAVEGVTPHVVFLNETEDRVDLVYSFRQAQGWALPRTVSTTLSISSNPALAIAGGVRYIAWSDAERLFLGRSSDGATWSVAPILINGVPVSGTAPDVVAAADGGLDLVWQVEVGGVARIRHATRHGGRWSLAEDLTSGQQPARLASVALLGQGDRLVAWLEEGVADLRRAQVVVGESEWWSAPLTLSGADDVAAAPQVAATGPLAAVAWASADGALHFRARAADGSWSAAEQVASTEAVDLALAAAMGEAYLAWSAPATGGGEILLRRRADDTVPVPTDPASPTATVALPSATATGTPAEATAGTPTSGATQATATVLASTVPASRTPSPTASPLEGTPTPRDDTPTPPPSSATPTSQGPSATPTQRPGPAALYLPFTWTSQRPAVSGNRSGAELSALTPAWSDDRLAGEAWSVPEEIARLPGETWQIALAIDHEARPHVLWESNGLVRHSTRGGPGWSAAETVAHGEAPAVALDEAGRLHALFANSFDGNQEIYHVTFEAGHWSLPVNVSHTSSFSVGPVLHSGSGQTPLVATWAELRPEGPMVYYGFWDGADWHSRPLVQARGLGPALAVDAFGPALAWHSRAETDRPFDVYAARGSGLRGTDWSLPENVSDSRDEDSVVASLALDARTWHVAWQEGSAQTAGVAYARRYEAGWGEVESLADVSSSPPKVLTTTSGAREVVWLAGTAVWSARGIGEGGWQTEPVPPAAAGAVAAAVAGDSDGGLHLAWAETVAEGQMVLRYARRLGCDGCRVLLPFTVKRW